MSVDSLCKELKFGHIIKLKTIDQMRHLGYKFRYLDDKLMLVDSHDFCINSDLIPLLGTNQKVFSVDKPNTMYFVKLVGQSSELVGEAIDRVIGVDNDEEKYVANQYPEFKIGEVVLVSNSKRGWIQRIFVGYNGMSGKYICVEPEYDNNFLSGLSFMSRQWNNIKKYKLEERGKKVLKAPAIRTHQIGGAEYISNTLYSNEYEARSGIPKDMFISWPATLMLGSTPTPMWVEVEE